MPRLRASLAAAGHDHPAERVAAALAGEIAYYRRHLDRGRDAASLADLRRDCARVLADGLGGDAPGPDHLARLLVDALRFRPFPDVAPALEALRARGVVLAVVSNWDCSLADVLERLALRQHFAAVLTSAEVGAAKPDPAIFRRALDLLAVRADEALHCGDLAAKDGDGALGAGIRALIIDRTGAPADHGHPVIRDLREISPNLTAPAAPISR